MVRARRTSREPHARTRSHQLQRALLARLDRLVSRPRIPGSPRAARLQFRREDQPNFYPARTYRAAIFFHYGFHELAIDDNNEATLSRARSSLCPTPRVDSSRIYEGDYELADQYNQMSLAREPGLVHANVQRRFRTST